MKKTLLAICILSISYAFTSVNAQNPVSYRGTLDRNDVAEFSYPDLDRQLVDEKVAAFHAPEHVEMDFSVLVRSDGTVSYVRLPRVDDSLYVARKICADALYRTTFAASDDAQGDRWYKVNMVAGPGE